MKNAYNFKKLLKESVDDNRLQNNKAQNEKIKLFKKAKNILNIMQNRVVTTTSYLGKQYDKTMKTIQDMGWQDQFWDFCIGKYHYRQSFDEKPVRKNKSLKRNRKLKQAQEEDFRYVVKINYGGDKSEEHYKTLKQAKHRWASWYEHMLDMVGQIRSTLDIYDTETGQCVFSDIM